jgi:hypothetical protein
MSEAERSFRNRRAKRWTSAQAREVIERWRASGQTAAAFATQQRISATRLSYWSKQLEQREVEPPQLVAVPISASRPPAARATIEIEVAGLILRVREDVDARYLVQLIAALRDRGGVRC